MSEAVRMAQRHTPASRTERQWGAPGHPAVSVELYGTLRIRTGRTAVALRADSIRTAMRVLVEAVPGLTRLLPPEEELPSTHRFSINGSAVTTDLDTPLREGDHLVLFSASVGG
jgi:molybdopterin converting factor small subunit